MTDKQLNNDDLKKVTGGEEPEEFDYVGRKYETPIKPDDGKGWKFEPIGNDGGFLKEDK